MSEQRPEYFTVDYNGTPLQFERVQLEGFNGYSFKCPRCARETPEHFATNWIDTESGTRHGLKFDEQGRATLEGSILCKTQYGTAPVCNWHVVIENGVCRDV